MSGLHQSQIAGAAADVHVEHRFAGLGGEPFGACAFGCQDAFQIRPSGCDYEFPGKFLQAVQNGPGVFLPCGLAGDDDGPSGYQLGLNSRQTVFLRHDLPNACRIQPCGRQKGVK